MTTRDLAAYVRRLLDDARNPSVWTHTRYSAACRALATLCDAGCGSSADRATVARWEDQRYGGALVLPPTEADVATIVARVLALLDGSR